MAAAVYTTLSIFGMVSFWTGFISSQSQWEVYLAYVGVVVVSCMSFIPPNPSI